MSVDTCIAFLDLLYDSPDMGVAVKATTDPRELVALGRRHGYLFDPAAIPAALSQMDEQHSALFTLSAPPEATTARSSFYHWEFDLTSRPELSSLADALNPLKIKPATFDPAAFAATFDPEDLGWTDMSPADAAFAPRYRDVMTSPWDPRQPDYLRRDFHLVALDSYIEDPRYETFFQAKVRMIGLLEDLFKVPVRFSSSLWYPPGAYRLWHTNETQPGWRMYLIDLDDSYDATQGRPFFRYMNPETHEVVTLEEHPKMMRFFKIEQAPENRFWHCIVNPTPSDRWSFGFEVPEQAVQRLAS